MASSFWSRMHELIFRPDVVHSFVKQDEALVRPFGQRSSNQSGLS